MNRYVKQIIEDLIHVANNPPVKPWIEPPPHIEDDMVVCELALVPFKTIEEWTGISMDAFPEMIKLNHNQCQQLNEAIFSVFESLNLELTDLPPDIPPEVLYDILITNWNHPVQYLPSSGMDLEFCTGDPDDCPYGEYCSCTEPFEEFELPADFNELVPKIADSINAGFVCFLNPGTLELEEIPQKMLIEPDDFFDLTGASVEDEEFQYEKWDNYWIFKPLESSEAFKIMEVFAENISNQMFSDKLFHSLSHRKPFANFKAHVEGSEYRDNWFQFKQEQLENHVKELIHNRLNEWFKKVHSEINGLYNDDGTKILTETIPLPSLCVICKHHNAGDWEENILCLLNRNDQRGEDEFRCGAFEKLG